MNRVKLLTPDIRHLVKVTSLVDKTMVSEHVERTLLDFIRRQEDDFNGFRDVRTGIFVLNSLFPHMSPYAKKLVSRGMWAPMIRHQ